MKPTKLQIVLCYIWASSVLFNNFFSLSLVLPISKTSTVKEFNEISLTGINEILLEEDSLALVSIYISLDSLNWATKWDLNSPVNSWAGIGLSSNGKRVNSIDLTKNGLNGILPESINRLTDLKFLLLGGNQGLSTIESLDSLAKLETLEVQNCNLDSIPSLNGLKSLSKFFCGENNLTTLPPMDSIQNLVWLQVERNKLTYLPPSVYNLSNLKTFTAQWNLFSTLESFDKWVNLEQLRISSHYLDTLPSLNKLKKLWQLNLGGDSLEIIPSLDSLENLSEFSYSNGENLSNIPSFARNQKLTNLYVDDCRNITSFPSLITNTKLRKLTISRVGIDSFPYYSQLDSLQTLNLGGNPQLIWTNTLDMDDLINLRELSLAGIRNQPSRQLSTLPDLGNLLNLTSLEIINNNLEVIPGLNKLSNLKRLVFTSNQIKSIEGIENLNKITVINGSYNPNLTSFPMDHLNNLETLGLEGCRFIYNLDITKKKPLLRFVNVTNTNISSFPIDSLPALKGLRSQNNRLDFGDYQQIMNSTNKPDSILRFWPQDSLEVEQFYGGVLDSSLVIAGKIEGTGNIYQWYKNGVLISGANANTYSFSTLTLADTGVYTLSITNAETAGITLTTRAKHVSVYEQAPPVDPDDPSKIPLIIDFSRIPIDSQSVLREAFSEIGILQDTCMCNDLEIWAFPDSIFDTTAIGSLRQFINASEVDKEVRKIPVEKGDAIDTTITISWNYPINLGLPKPGNAQWRADSLQDLEVVEKILIAIPDFGIDPIHEAVRSFMYFDNIPGFGKDGCYENDSSSISFSGPKIKSVHGTSIAGVTASFHDSTSISLLDIQVGGATGEAQIFDLACGIRYAIEHEAKIITLSIGYKGEESELLTQLMKETEEKGILVIIGAGNDGLNLDSTDYWPAKYNFNNIITVTAYDPETNFLPPFANHGPSIVDAAGPGVNIHGAQPGQAYGPISGTSIVVGFFAATAAAIMADDSSLTGDSVRNILLSDKFMIQDTNLIDKVANGRRINLQITDCSKKPLSRSDNLIWSGESIFTIDVLKNDCYGPDMYPVVTRQPKYGNVTWNNLLRKFEYQINPLFGIKDTFTYQLCPATGDSCATAEVYLVLSEPSLEFDDQIVKVFPNPTQGPITFEYEVKNPTSVSLSILDLQGREIKLLIDNVSHEIGDYKYIWQHENLQSGIYFYQFILNNEIQPGKIIIQP